MTIFSRNDDGTWRRDDERHDNVLVDTATIPDVLRVHGVDAEVRDAFGTEDNPDGPQGRGRPQGGVGRGVRGAWTAGGHDGTMAPRVPYPIVRMRRGFVTVSCSISASETPRSRSRGRNVVDR